MSGSQKIQSYKDLIAWQKAMDLVVTVYRVTEAFPSKEQFGLIAQLRRAAVSVPSNIAEGYGRVQRRDYVRFLDMARASTNEVETQLLIAQRLRFGDDTLLREILTSLDELQRILKALIFSLRRAGNA